MTLNGWIQIALYFGCFCLTVKPLGRYMTDVFDGERTFLSFICCARSSAPSTRSAASTRTKSSTGSVYGVAMLVFSLAGFRFALCA